MIKKVSVFMTVLPYPRQFRVMARFTIIKSLQRDVYSKRYSSDNSSVIRRVVFLLFLLRFWGNSSAITRAILRNVLQLCCQNKWDRVFRFFLFCQLSVKVSHFNIVDRGSLFFFTRKSKGLFDWKSGIRVHGKWKKL